MPKDQTLDKSELYTLLTNPWSHTPALLSSLLGNCKLGGCKETHQPFASSVPTFRQPFANLSPTLCQPFCQPLSEPLFPWTPGADLETRVNSFLAVESPVPLLRKYIPAPPLLRLKLRVRLGLVSQIDLRFRAPAREIQSPEPKTPQNYRKEFPKWPTPYPKS